MYCWQICREVDWFANFLCTESFGFTFLQNIDWAQSLFKTKILFTEMKSKTFLALQWGVSMHNQFGYFSFKSCHPTFTDKKVSDSRPHGCKKLKVLREFHWQSFWSTRLTKMSQWLHLNNSHAYPFCETMPGTNSESRQQSCAIELRQQFFRCSNCDHIFFSETCSKQSQNYSVSESEGAPFK